MRCHILYLFFKDISVSLWLIYINQNVFYPSSCQIQVSNFILNNAYSVKLKVYIQI